MSAFKDITGQRFGKLIVVLRRPNKKNGMAMWECQCDCGNVTVVAGISLRQEHTKSCGACYFRRSDIIDLVGQRFGKLLVVSQASPRRGSLYWLCQCDCGKTASIRGSSLRLGISASCGCTMGRGPKNSKWKGCGMISGEYWSHLLNGAKRRGITLTITLQDAWAQFQRQKGICALTGIPLTFSDCVQNRTKMTTASLDRIDSNRGYEKDNIQWIHKDVQAMKMSKSQQCFIDLCRAVAQHSNQITRS